MRVGSAKVISNDKVTNGNIQILLTVANFDKFKKLNLVKSKMLDLAKNKKSNFIKINVFRIDFLISKLKKVFTYIQKTFTNIIIFHNFWLKHYI